MVVGSVLGLLIMNAVVFSAIFWILTNLAKYYYSNKFFNYKLDFYECGFQSLTNYQVTYNVNYLLLLLFLLIYDGEFLVLIPFSLNLGAAGVLVQLVFIIFLSWLVMTLVCDLLFGALEWHA